jgi:hypothetical protein
MKKEKKMTTSLGNPELEIKIGDPIILDDAKGLGKYGLRRGMKGTANVIVNVDDKDIVGFMGVHNMKIYYIALDRVVLDEEAAALPEPEEE